MNKKIREFWRDEGGDTSTVFKLVLAVTVIAAILVILLYVLQSAQVGGGKLTSSMGEATEQLSTNLTNFTKS